MHKINTLVWAKKHYKEHLGRRNQWTTGKAKEQLEELFDRSFQGGTLLEIGSFVGEHIPWFQKKASKIICTELFKEAFLHIREHVKNLDKVHFELISGRDLRGIQSNSVDYIFSVDSLVRLTLGHYIEYAEEFYRVLRMGGKFLVHIALDSRPYAGAHPAPPHTFSKEKLQKIHKGMKISVSGEEDIPSPAHWGGYVLGEKI